MRCSMPFAVEKIRQDVLGEIRLALVEIAGEQFHRQQPAPFEIEQQRQQAVGILAAGKRHQPALARLDHGELLERLARVAHQPLAQLVELHTGWHAEKHRVATGSVGQFLVMNGHVNTSWRFH